MTFPTTMEVEAEGYGGTAEPWPEHRVDERGGVCVPRGLGAPPRTHSQSAVVPSLPTPPHVWKALPVVHGAACGAMISVLCQITARDTRWSELRSAWVQAAAAAQVLHGCPKLG